MNPLAPRLRPERHTWSLIVRILLLAPLAFAARPELGGADWVQDGGALNLDIAMEAQAPAIALSAGTPYVAWQEYNGAVFRVYVKHFAGAAWVQDGPSLNINLSNFALTPSLAFQGLTPYAAWAETNGVANQIHVAHYTGAAWVQDGVSLNVNATHQANYPSLGFAGNTPYVAWQEDSGSNTQIFAGHYNGAAWVRDGAALNVNMALDAVLPSLAVAGTTPFVGWGEYNGLLNQNHVKHFNGAAWVPDGGALNVNAANDAGNPSLAFAGTTPYAAWKENNGSNDRVFVSHFSGGGWIRDGGPLNVNASENADAPSLVCPGTTPYVAWFEASGAGDQIYVSHFSGAVWLRDGAGLNVNAADVSMSPRIVFTSATPYVAWQEGGISTNNRVYVKHFPPPTPVSTATAVPTLTPGTIPWNWQNVRAFPIPGRGTIHFAIRAQGPAQVAILIYNQTAERVAALTGGVDPDHNVLSWDCSQNGAGVYLAVVSADGKEIGKCKVAVAR